MDNHFLVRDSELTNVIHVGVGRAGFAGAQIGDILRAVTTTTFDVPVAASLTGEPESICVGAVGNWLWYQVN